MGYIVGAAILALVIIGFTRKTIVVMAGLVAMVFASVAFYLVYDAHRQRKVENLNASLLTSIAYDTSCAVDVPIRMTLQNTSPRVLQAVTFDVAGYRDGHSTPLYRTRDYLSDRILNPSEGWTECYPLPAAIRGTDTSGLAEHPPETLRWSIEDLAGTFTD